MKLFILSLLSLAAQDSISTDTTAFQPSQEEINKKIALDFYHDLWQTDNTDQYAKYVATEYIVHDIGDRKGVKEPAVQQKLVADRFWDNGEMDLEFVYQIAEGDLVATRWIWKYKANTLMGKLMFGEADIPIINVFRFKDGKIVEIWNHRHDIDTPFTNFFVLEGLLYGLLIALIPTFVAIRRGRKIRKLKSK